MLRVAAIDVGSNAVRLVMVELSRAGRLVDTEYHRYPVGLGREVFSHGRLSDRRIEALLDVFGEINEHMARRVVQRYRAVGTAAMREATNGHEVVQRIKQSCGLELEIIDGQEEGRLSRNALWRAVGWAPEDTLLLDLGGGTLELERANRRARVSLPLGTARLLELYPDLMGPVSQDELEVLVAKIDGELRRHTRMSKPATTLIGTGGNLISLTRIVPAKGSWLPAIDVARLPDLLTQMAAMNAPQRAREFDLRPDRAELVVAGLTVLTILVRRFGVHTFIVPGTGLRDSVLHELTAPQAVDGQARSVLARFGQRLREPEIRARIARQLFELTATLHELWQPALPPLLVAAYLLDVGRVVDPEASGEHSSYIIRHVSGLSLGERGRAIAAATAEAAQNGTLGSFAQLSDIDGVVAKRNTILLRLAMALVARQVTQIRHAYTLGSPLTIECGVDRDLPADVIADAERELACKLQIV